MSKTGRILGELFLPNPLIFSETAIGGSWKKKPTNGVFSENTEKALDPFWEIPQKLIRPREGAFMLQDKLKNQPITHLRIQTSNQPKCRPTIYPKNLGSSFPEKPGDHSADNPA